MRRLGAHLVLALVLGLLAACGDDGDASVSSEFCDGLESLSDAIADGDLDEQIETINDEIVDVAADGEELDAVENLVNDYEDEGNDQAELAEEVEDELGEFAEECGIDEDEFAIAPTTTTETTEPSETTDTSAGSETTLPAEESGPDVLARAELPADIAAEYADLANACFEGDMEACDTLYDTTPPGSVDEAYGATCGGRLAEADAQASECATIITGPVDVPAEILDQANAQACYGGDMLACDELFDTSESDSLDELYGALCGGRVPATQAYCVDIFGEVAFL
jgi:chemotaxis protein histidine kinase CheA